ncbi:unnamed protein product [Orchesella dallaii]|uniref:Transmembrane protein n=1 Tax=Orchesella dallaii TaxID=48710 RepID=A0ABP1PSK3_9HEXA
MIPKMELPSPCFCVSSITGAIIIGSLLDILYGITEAIFVLMTYGGPVDDVSSHLWNAMMSGVIMLLITHVYFSSMLLQGVTKERVRKIKVHLIFRIIHFLVSLTIICTTLHLQRFSIGGIISVLLLRLYFIFVVYCSLVKTRGFVAMSESGCGDDSFDELIK